MKQLHKLTGWLCLLAMTAATSQSFAADASGKPLIDPRYVGTVNKAVGYLETEHKKGERSSLRGGTLSLAAYAVMKAGRPKNHPIVQDAIKHILGHIDGEGVYKPGNDREGVYEAGVDIMVLAAADPKTYFDQIGSLSTFLISRQQSDGSWTYPGDNVGDTSMTQYAVLGFWAAQRSGVEVPLEVWNKAAQWHIKTQQRDGGFAYHPGTTVGPERGASTHNLTNAAGGSLLICRINMYPDLPPLGTAGKKKEKPKKKFGVLEKGDASAGESETKAARREIDGFLSAGQLEGAAKRAMGWYNARFVLDTPNVNKNYYYYTVERFASLYNVKQIAGRDWFYTLGDRLVQKQLTDGSWDTFTNNANATALGILFLTRSTGKILKLPDVGGGLLAGGRGLPDDLSEASLSGGKVKKRKIQGDLDQLLTDFEKLDLSALEDQQTAIVEKIQLGSQEELLGQLPRIRKLIEHPNGDIRRTAVWALGRSGDLGDANMLIQRLEENDVGVLMEANSALCYLSRKLQGIGVPADPLEGLPEKPSQAQIDAAVAAWKKDAIEKWTTWYLRIRPYDDRNDLFQLKFGRKIKKK